MGDGEHERAVDPSRVTDESTAHLPEKTAELLDLAARHASGCSTAARVPPHGLDPGEMPWTSGRDEATLASVKALLSLLALGAVAGCGGALTRSPVTYVWTRTPGVVFVVVHPEKPHDHLVATLDASGKPVDSRADYLLLCDGRKGDGMHCDLATEQAVKRYSYAPAAGAAGATIEEPIGSIPTEADILERQVHPAPEAAPPPPLPVAPPPPPPPPAASAAPAPPAGGKK